MSLLFFNPCGYPILKVNRKIMCVLKPFKSTTWLLFAYEHRYVQNMKTDFTSDTRDYEAYRRRFPPARRIYQ
ncbi:hypothetical protein X975_05184, partial [Stegodyphus mimosarum]